jgi:zinc transporter ZupT
LLTLTEAISLGVVTGIVPILVGFTPSYLVDTKGVRWKPFSAGLAVGFLSIFFTDLMDDAASLGVSSGLPITQNQLVLASSFVFGFLAFTLLERKLSSGKPSSRIGIDFLAYLVAAGIGLHSIGEGLIVGNSIASQVPIWELSSLFQGVSFSLHKFLEGFTITVFFKPQPSLRTGLVCMTLAGIPYLAGISLGLSTYTVNFANLFFALGAGSVIFMVIQLAPILKSTRVTYAAVGFIVGFVLVYLGTLIHFTGTLY